MRMSSDRLLRSCITVLALLAVVPVARASEIDLWVTGLTPDQTAPTLLESFSFSVKNYSITKPKSASKTTASDLTVTAPIDSNSTRLFKYAAGGTGATVTIDLCKPGCAGPGSEKFEVLTLTDALISRFSVSGGGGAPTESITFNYQSVHVSYLGSDAGKTENPWTTLMPYSLPCGAAIGLPCEQIIPDIPLSFFASGPLAGNDILGARLDGQPSDYGANLPDVLYDVPEPATLGLMGLGLAGIGFARRKRKGADATA